MPKPIPMEEIVRRNGGTIISVHNAEKDQYLFKCSDLNHSTFTSNRAYIENCYHFCPMCIKFQMEKYVKYSLYLIFNKQYEFSCRKPDWLESLKNYHIDMYNKEIRFALEIDGNSHDKLLSYHLSLHIRDGTYYDPAVRDKTKDDHAKRHGINVLRLRYNSGSLRPKHYAKIKGELYDLVSSQYTDICHLMTKEDFLATNYTIDEAKQYYFEMRKNEANMHIIAKGSATMIDFKYGPRRTKCILVLCAKEGCDERKYWSFDDVVRTDDNARCLYCEICAPITVTTDRIKEYVEDRQHTYISHERRCDAADKQRIYVSFICGICGSTHEQMWDNLHRQLTYDKCPISREGRGRISAVELDKVEAGMPTCIRVIKRHDVLERVSELICTKTNTRFNASLKDIKRHGNCIPCALNGYINTIRQYDPTNVVTCQEDLTKPQYGDKGPGLAYGGSWAFTCGKCNETYYVCRFSATPAVVHRCLEFIKNVVNNSKPNAKEADRRHKDKVAKQKDLLQRVNNYCISMGSKPPIINGSIATIKCSNPSHESFNASIDSLLHNKTWCVKCDKIVFKKTIAYCIYKLTRHPSQLKRLTDEPKNYILMNKDVLVELIRGKKCLSDDDIDSLEHHHIALKYDSPTLTDELRCTLYDGLDDIYDDLKMTRDSFLSMNIDLPTIYDTYEKIKKKVIEHMLIEKGSALVTPADYKGMITVKCAKCKTNTGKWNHHDIMSAQKKLYCEECNPLEITDALIQSKLDLFEHILVSTSYKEKERYVTFKCNLCNNNHEYSYKSIRAAYNNGSQTKLCVNNKVKKVDDRLVLERIKNTPAIAHISLVDSNRKLSKPSIIFCPLTGIKFKVDELVNLVGKKGSHLPKCMACNVHKFIQYSHGSLTLLNDPMEGLTPKNIRLRCNDCNKEWDQKITATTCDYHKC